MLSEIPFMTRHLRTELNIIEKRDLARLREIARLSSMSVASFRLSVRPLKEMQMISKLRKALKKYAELRYSSKLHLIFIYE